MSYRKPSIYTFLLVGLLSFTFAYFSITYWISQKQAIHEIEELFDAQLVHSANILFNLLGESVSTIDQSSKHLPIVYHGLETMVPKPDNRSEWNALHYQRKLAYQIFNSDGKLLIKSNSAPSQSLGSQKVGLSRLTIENETWRVITYYDEDWNFWLHVAESESIREELSDELAKKTLLPGLIGLPILLLIITFIVRSGLHPLRVLATHISEREPKNLKPIRLEGMPKEITPVIWSINSLFIRLEEAIAREKKLTADAAHELRTPLSVVMLHAQNALVAKNESDRSDALKELEKGVKRVGRLLEQILTMSKVNPEIIPRTAIDLVAVSKGVVSEMAPVIYERDQEIEWQCDDESIMIEGSDFLLEILLRNLIENSSVYSPELGQIRVSALRQPESGKVVLRVEDSGPGISPEDLPKITDRFYRIQQGEGKGAGLGLALVKSIVEFHGGDLEFTHSSMGGLNVCVTLPLVNAH